ncbi:MAG: RNA ligase RtcB family protein [Verrucomicrobiota bacterium]
MNTDLKDGSSGVRLVPEDRGFFESMAIDQLMTSLRLPGVLEIFGYPDLHPGKGLAVGSTVVTENWVYPYLIGGDIGCGMGFWKTDLKRRKAKLDKMTKCLSGLEQADESMVEIEIPFADAMGTIGGGNHFAEIQEVESIFDEDRFAAVGLTKGELCLLVHSGSRGFGNMILNQHTRAFRDGGFEYGDEKCDAYLKRHDEAVEWARRNRSTIAARVGAILNLDVELISDAPHNLIEAKEVSGKRLWIHRKGAAVADRGMLMIAGSRGTLSYLVEPIDDCRNWGWSVSHGAGRKWQRSESYARMRERFRKEQLQQTDSGGRVICDDKRLLFEEAPQAFKNIDVVVGHLEEAGLIRRIAAFQPLISYKVRKEGRRK